MLKLCVCKRDERFTWDKFKKSEEDHKNMQKAFTKLMHKYSKTFVKVLCQKKHLLIMQSKSINLSEARGNLHFHVHY